MQAERDRVKSDEFVTKATAEKTSRDRSLVRLEDENAGLRQQLHTMQSQLAQVEHDHAQRSERTHSAYQRRSVRRSVVNKGGGNRGQVKPSNCFRRLEKLVLPYSFDTGLSSFIHDAKLAEFSKNRFE